MTVEFLPSEDPGPADEPAHQERRRPGSLWWVVAALVIAGATAWVATRPSPSPTSDVAKPIRPVARHADPLCRHVPDCSVRTDVPTTIGELVRTYLPAGMHVRVHTVIAVGSLTLRNQLVARDIDATVNSVSVLIRVRRGGSGTHAIVADPLGVGSLLLHGVNSGYVVRLQYLAPETVPPMLDRLQALIRDPRLTASPR
jgi:hypothetical protein